MQHGSKLAAVLLAASVLLQVSCPAGLLAAEVQAILPASHGGCHDSPSLPQGPQAPTPQQRCCAGAPVATQPLNGYSDPTPVMVERASSGQEPLIISLPPDFSIAPRLYPPPGFLILRI
jgi:hypothetical protein